MNVTREPPGSHHHEIHVKGGEARPLRSTVSVRVTKILNSVIHVIAKSGRRPASSCVKSTS